MKQHLRLNAPELRQLNSRMLKDEVQDGWETQRAKNDEVMICHLIFIENSSK